MYCISPPLASCRRESAPAVRPDDGRPARRSTVPLKAGALALIGLMPPSGSPASSGWTSVLAVDDLAEEVRRADDVHPHHGVGEVGPAVPQRRDELAVTEERLRALVVVLPERAPEGRRDAGDGAQG